MGKVSKKQKQLLETIEHEKRVSYRHIQEVFDLFLEPPPDEDFDPRWQTIWEKIAPRAHDFAPAKYVRKIEEIIKAIEVVDEQISRIRIKDGTKITFLLGAGASAPSGIPTVDKLLSELWNRARKIGRDDLDRLADWCIDRGITNIEDLLTAAYISNFSSKNTSVTSLLDYFLFSAARTTSQEEEYTSRSGTKLQPTQIDVSSISFLQETLQTLFALLTNTMISAKPNPTHHAIVNFLKAHKNTSIITTNYDGCMDEAILDGKLKIRGTLAPDSNSDNTTKVDLIKMHGSINWTYCDSCHDAREFDLLELKNAYNDDTLSYPVMGICKNCGGLRRPLLVPPLSFQFLMFPTLIDIWNSARQRIEEADYLIIIGYSFSEADTYITKILSRSMAMNSNQKMIIINIDPKLATLLIDRFSAHIDQFDKARILRAVKSSEEIVPHIVKSLLGQSAEPKNAKTKTASTAKTTKRKKHAHTSRKRKT